MGITAVSRNIAPGRLLPAALEFVYPRRTLPVSSTGRSCTLNCAHCAGHYLQKMHTLPEALAETASQPKSYLVSGGFTKQGIIPHGEHRAELAALSRRAPLNMHTGLIGPDEATWLGSVAGAASFDFVQDARVIEDIYGLEKTPDDYLRSYRTLKKHLRTIPHLCLGLSGSSLREEYRALQILREEGAEAISIIVFRPTPGTRMAACFPPPLPQVELFLHRARRLLPETPLYLGCLRPGGRYRQALDSLAVRVGMKKIVHPSPPARKLAAKLGRRIEYSEECCIF